MENLKNKTLALFFTCGISIEIWKKVGNIEREIKLYNELALRFKKIYFVTYGSKKEFSFQDKLSKNIEILPKKLFLPSKIYQFLIPIIYHKELKEADIYKTNQMAAAVPAFLSKRLYKKKLIVRCGYEWLEFLRKEKRPFWERMIVFIIEKIAYKNSERIILSSEKDRRFVKNNFKTRSSRIEVIPNYINTELFKPIKTEKYKSGVIFVGRLHKQKNLFNLVEAISGTSYKLILIGSGFLRKEIEFFAKKKAVDIEFKKNIINEKLPEELNKAEIFILPSLYEGCPKALLEAMSCGLPCIGTNVEGIKEIIRHRENGYLCDTDANSIKKAIIEVLQDNALQKKIGRGARQTILENFNFNKILEKEINIYKTL